MATMTTLRFTGDESANRFISTNPLALVVGMLLDQQVPMERAFAAPYELSQRLDVPFEAEAMAALPVDAIELYFRQPPALHRYPGMMARRVHALCVHVVTCHHGDAAAVWRHAVDGPALFGDIRALPGFGDQKARAFVALLGKQLGVQPPGWEDAAGSYGLPGYRSVADVTDRESLDRVRTYKRELERAEVDI